MIPHSLHTNFSINFLPFIEKAEIFLVALQLNRGFDLNM